jgi:hypothetical protein
MGGVNTFDGLQDCSAVWGWTFVDGVENEEDFGVWLKVVPCSLQSFERVDD